MNEPRITRRPFLASALAAGAGLTGLSRRATANTLAAKLPPVRVITNGPKHHWFGYYDKRQFDPSGRYCLGMEVDFEHRSPRSNDAIAVGMVDLEDGDRWIELGRTTAWCWQQGCMLQWIPGSKTKVLFNDREDGKYVCRILDVESRQMRTVPHAIYAISPDARTAVVSDFRRLGDVRPGYGYNGFPDPVAEEPTPKDTGVFKVDLETGEKTMLFSIAEVAAFGKQLPARSGAKHWINHLLFNQDGSRFIFLHRWQKGRSRATRMLTASPDGADLRVVDANGLTSHFIWRDPRHVLAWSDQPSHGPGFYLFEDGGKGSIEVVGVDAMTRDGHCSYLPGAEWILNDTYPDANRMQSPFLFHVPSGLIAPLGHFRSPKQYTGEWRCDTHPRFSPTGRQVVIDSPTASAGRQLHLIDVSEIVT